MRSLKVSLHISESWAAYQAETFLNSLDCIGKFCKMKEVREQWKRNESFLNDRVKVFVYSDQSLQDSSGTIRIEKPQI